MKILLCAPFKGRTRNNPGGIAVWARNVYSYYKLQGGNIVIDVYSIDRKHDFDNIFSIKRIWFGVQEYFVHFVKFCVLINTNQFDVVHLCSSASISLIKDFLFIKKAKRNSVKSVVHFHFGRIPDLFEKKNWEYRLICLVSRVATTIVVMDVKSYNTLIKAGFSNVKYLPNPLSLSVCDIIENQKVNFINRRDGEVLFAGHVIPSKGVYELVIACAKCNQVKKLSFIGSIENDRVRLKMETIADKIRGDHNWIYFAGAVEHKQVIREMLRCSIFVLPSYTEGFPNVILEAMACACPIITTPVGAIPEMLEGRDGERCGVFVNVKDSKTLQLKIQHYLVDKLDAQYLGNRAKVKVYSAYSMEKVWSLLNNIWASTIVCEKW